MKFLRELFKRSKRNKDMYFYGKGNLPYFKNTIPMPEVKPPKEYKNLYAVMDNKRDITIFIAKDFSQEIGARYRTQGKYSGEEFFEDCLFPKFKEAVKNNVFLIINLDNTLGYSAAFLEEAFMRLGAYYKNSYYIKSKIVLISEEEPLWKDSIYEYISRGAGDYIKEEKN